MTVVVCALFFVSGAAALVFEALWFHQAGLAFGNGVWSAAITLAAFMAGLAAGNGLAARHGPRLRRPLRAYAALEVAIAAGGVAAVYGLPRVGAALAPTMGELATQPGVLGTLRFVGAFAVMLLPTTAMGATLPLLIRALLRVNPSFGSALGRLYGWNTIGAVAGVLTAELLLIERLGITGSAITAAALDLLVAGVALRLSTTIDPGAPEQPTRTSMLPTRWLLAAGLGGASMLALEVVWFRLLRLVQAGSALVFAVMVAVVLAGIGLGGLLAGRLSRRWPGMHRHVCLVGWVAGVAVVACYRLLWPTLLAVGGDQHHDMLRLVVYGGVLMLPTAILSGILFTWLGETVQEQVGLASRSTGLLTLANTTGAAMGSLVGGFVLLPMLGIESALALLASSYGALALLLPHPSRRHLIAAAAWGLAMLLFPRGHLEDTYFAHVLAPYRGQLVEVRQSPIQTAFLVRTDRFGAPFSYRLATDHHSMSSTDPLSQRYMKLFVWLPVALRPDPERALVISYGVGSTAKALVGTRSLRHIDVVDISRDILELSPRVHGDADPLTDPRVHVHVEDGRFFLQTSPERYDLVTGEPPPPKEAGVVNLYTREYFALLRGKLRPGGVASYWLPVHALTDSDTRAIMAAFCEVFDDCTLWSGGGLDWILLGTRELDHAPSIDAFSAPWRDPDLRVDLHDRGLETPAQLAALFLGGTADLRAWTTGVDPVTDDHPRRIGTDPVWVHTFSQFYADVMDPAQIPARFAASPFVARMLPPEARDDPPFEAQAIINGAHLPVYRTIRRWSGLDQILGDTSFEVPVLWLLGSDPIEQNILEARAVDPSDPAARYARAVGQLARRTPAALETLRGLREEPAAVPLLLYVACREGELDSLRELEAAYRAGRPDTDLLDVLDRRCPTQPPVVVGTP